MQCMLSKRTHSQLFGGRGGGGGGGTPAGDERMRPLFSMPTPKVHKQGDHPARNSAVYAAARSAAACGRIDSRHTRGSVNVFPKAIAACTSCRVPAAADIASQAPSIRFHALSVRRSMVGSNLEQLSAGTSGVA